MECKFACNLFSGDTSSPILIETYWNVNVVLKASAFDAHAILIETYWNVNDKNVASGDFFSDILIETYWNVNYFEMIKEGIKTAY